MTQVHAKSTKAMNMKTNICNIQAPVPVIFYLSVQCLLVPNFEYKLYTLLRCQLECCVYCLMTWGLESWFLVEIDSRLYCCIFVRNSHMSGNNVQRNWDTDTFCHILIHKIPLDNVLYKIKYTIKYHENNFYFQNECNKGTR